MCFSVSISIRLDSLVPLGRGQTNISRSLESCLRFEERLCDYSCFVVLVPVDVSLISSSHMELVAIPSSAV